MKIIDSTFWIEYFANYNYIEILNPLLEDQQKVIIPTLIITEVYKKLFLIMYYDTAKIYISQFLSFKIVENDVNIAVESSELGIKHKPPLADSIIYATAIKFITEIYTFVKHFEGLPNVQTFEKNKFYN